MSLHYYRTQTQGHNFDKKHKKEKTQKKNPQINNKDQKNRLIFKKLTERATSGDLLNPEWLLLCSLKKKPNQSINQILNNTVSN